MAKKGGKKSQKVFATGKARLRGERKGRWAIKSIAGAFDKKSSIPLGYLLRDLLNIGRNLREVKIALNDGLVSVNGRVKRDYRFPVGFFDIVSVDGLEKDYRAVFDLRGRLIVREIKKEKQKSKLCRIMDKKASKKGLIQLKTNDGRNIFLKTTKLDTGDSVEIELPSQKVLKTMKFEKGAKAFIVGGKHAGKRGTVKEIKPGTMESERLVTLKSGTKEFQTIASNVFVVGEEFE